MAESRLATQFDASAYYRATARTVADWERIARQLVSEGQAFLAHDLAHSALRFFPDSRELKRLSARALVSCGAIERAQRILDELCPTVAADDRRLLELYSSIRRTVDQPIGSPTAETTRLIASILRNLRQATEFVTGAGEPDDESYTLLADVYKELFRRTGAFEYAVRARDTYIQAYELRGTVASGIGGAFMLWLLGDALQAHALATTVLQKLAAIDAIPAHSDEFDTLVVRAAAHLILGHAEPAFAAYADAIACAGNRFLDIDACRRQLLLAQDQGKAVPGGILNLLAPPTIVVFVGHMIDSVDRATPRFPPQLEAAVGRAIGQSLEKMNARIGYSAAACGGDLLFVEEMQNREAEVNIVLPFETEDYVAASVAHAGRRWVTRFHKACRLANSVKHVTEERFLGDTVLFSFAARVFHGYAHLRGAILDTRPLLLAAWDGQASGLAAGTSHTIAGWSDQGRVEIIRIDRLLAEAAAGRLDSQPASAAIAQPSRPDTSRSKPGGGPGTLERRIRTMLFADVVGYSTLREESTPSYMFEFLARVAEFLRREAPAPEFVNTWGDAIFAVMQEAVPLARYAMALREVVTDTDWSQLGLSRDLNIRIALHTGPVFRCDDPFMGRPNFYGAHVNRAARLEPVSIPGAVYASEQFAALLSIEQVAAERDAREAGRDFARGYECAYVGNLSLAKSYGAQPVYQVRELPGAPFRERRGSNVTARSPEP